METKNTTTDKKLDCGVNSLPAWIQEMLAERMDRFLKAELEAMEEDKGTKAPVLRAGEFSGLQPRLKEGTGEF